MDSSDAKEQKKEQENRNIQNNANNIRNAAEVAKASANPYAKAIGTAVSAADKISGGKTSEMAGKSMNNLNKVAPGGKTIQNASNKLNESGASDKIGQAASAKSGGAGKGTAPEALKKNGPKKDQSSENNAKPADSSNASGESSKSTNEANSSSNGEEETSISNKKSGTNNLKLKLMLIGFFASLFITFVIVSYLIFAFNTLMTTIVMFFGINEGRTSVSTTEKEETGVWVEEQYLEKDGEPLPLDDYTDENGNPKEGLLTTLAKEGGCPEESMFQSIIYFWTGLLNDFGEDGCRLLNYIDYKSKILEDRYKEFGLDIDENIIISSLFFGYDEQVPVIAYDNPEDANFVEGSEHFNVLLNMVKNDLKESIIRPDDIKKIIDSSIYEDVWPYWILNVETNFDKDNNKIYEIQTNVTKAKVEPGDTEDEKLTKIKSELRKEFYTMIGTSDYSIEDILKINKEILKTNQYEDLNSYDNLDDLVKAIYNNANNKPIKILIPVSSAACIKMENDKTIHKFYYYSPEKLEMFLRFGEEAAELWTYDTNMNNAYINTSKLCRDSNIDIKEYDIKSLNYNGADKFFNNEGKDYPKIVYPYSQKIQANDLEGNKEVKIAPMGDISLDYRNGFAYQKFPAYKAANDARIKGFEYNPVETPKKLESVIQNIFERKDEFNSVLEGGEGLSYKDPGHIGGDNLNTSNYFGKINEYGTGDFEVRITDCNGKYMTTRSFKEYILGVTLAEIGYSAEDEYVKTQMVAAISYTLGRRDNHENSKMFLMKSGSCDQNWCDIYKGCSRSDVGGYVREGQATLLVTYPGTINNSVNSQECNIAGAVGYNHYKCPLETDELKRYSDLFDEAINYVIVGKTGDYFDEGIPTDEELQSDDFMGPYKDTVQQKWNALAQKGKSVYEILEETYPNSTIFTNADANNMENFIYVSWPHYNEKGEVHRADIEKICQKYNRNYDERWNEKVVEIAFRLAGKQIGDCSSFVRRVIRDASKELGIPTPGYLSSSTNMMQHYGQYNCANYDDLRVGDIIFERTNKERDWFYEVGHVGIFMGYDDSGNQLIFESNSGNSAGKFRGLSNPYDRPALVVDKNIHRIAGYVRWYPPANPPDK